MKRKSEKQFLAVDGEGYTSSDGEHHYMLMMNSEGDVIVNQEGLSTVECLRFLCKSSVYGKIIVGFGLSYDVNMILRDVNRNELNILYHGGEIEYEGYLLSYRNRKVFTVCRVKDNTKAVVWDVFGFFQCSFLKALDSYGIEYNRELVTAGKEARSTFEIENTSEICVYTQEECRALVELVSKLYQCMVEAGLTLTRFDGAGAAAAALLKRENVKRCYGGVPDKVGEASRYAYFGGRIECVKYGNTTQKVQTYDINSAYPYAATKLPSLVCGEWIEYVNTKPQYPQTMEDFSLYHIKWNFRKGLVIYPFPYRYHDGTVVFPSHGEGWIWAPELYSAAKMIPDLFAHIHLMEQFEFRPRGSDKPFAFIPQLYEQRRVWKEQGNGAEKALKLAINSLYGKCAQRVGWNSDKGFKPPYHCLEYAGFITSYTRAMLYTLAMQQPENLISLQTDGVFILGEKKLNADFGDGLGQWGGGVVDGITIVQSGIYWLNTQGEEQIEHYRGFDKGTLDRKAIVEAWKNEEETFTAKSTRFVTMGTALGSEDEYKLWRRWVTSERQLQLRMFDINQKRFDVTGAKGAHNHLITTIASPNLWSDTISTPYPLPWQQALISKDEAEIERMEATI